MLFIDKVLKEFTLTFTGSRRLHNQFIAPAACLNAAKDLQNIMQICSWLNKLVIQITPEVVQCFIKHFGGWFIVNNGLRYSRFIKIKGAIPFELYERRQIHNRFWAILT